MATNQFTDSTKEWTVDEHAGKKLFVLPGEAGEQEVTIVSNTATVLTVTPDLDPDPSTDDPYEIRHYFEATEYGIRAAPGKDVTWSGDLIVEGGGIVATGDQGPVTIPSGPGRRLMWIPSKGAFRVGSVGAMSWDEANIGIVSVASGVHTTASGNYGATAMGYFTTASGNYGATAMGYFTTASGDDGATALGSRTDASGNYGATAMGYSTTASGDNGVTAMGYSTTASGTTGATAMGYFTTASGTTGATALGSHTTASGFEGATALGSRTDASGNYGATAMGRNIEVSGNTSVGINLYGDSTARTVAEDNVFVVMGGNVGIGLVDPAHQLDIEGTFRTGANMLMSSDSNIFFGGHETDGTWKIQRDGDNLTFQRRESGSWVIKETITP